MPKYEYNPIPIIRDVLGDLENADQLSSIYLLPRLIQAIRVITFLSRFWMNVLSSSV